MCSRLVREFLHMTYKSTYELLALVKNINDHLRHINVLNTLAALR